MKTFTFFVLAFLTFVSFVFRAYALPPCIPGSSGTIFFVHGYPLGGLSVYEDVPNDQVCFDGTRAKTNITYRPADCTRLGHYGYSWSSVGPPVYGAGRFTYQVDYYCPLQCEYSYEWEWNGSSYQCIETNCSGGDVVDNIYCTDPVTCSNKQKDYSETGTDCGGSCSNACTDEEGPKLEDPVKKGNICTNSYVGSDTGEYFHHQKLLDLSGLPLSASLTLSYRSFARAGTIGTGWRHNYDIALRDDGSGNLVARMGSSERLYTDNSGTYTSEVDDYSTLVDNGDDTYTLTEKNGLSYVFNSSLKCTSITDRNGNQNILAYNDDNLLETVTDSAGRVLTFSYNSDDSLATITDPKGNVFTFTQTAHRLTSLALPDSAIWTYTYDDDGYLLTKTDPEGFTITNSYDTDHRILGSTDPNSLTKAISYPTDTSATELTTTVTEKDGNDWTYSYDTSAGVLDSKTNGEGYTTSYTWDSDKNLLSKTEPGTAVTSYTYDDEGNVLTMTDALSHVTTFTYNSYGQILTATGPRGTIENSYDDNGNLIQIKNYDDTVTQFAYNSKGQVIQMVDALSRITTFVYDSTGLLTSVTPPSGITQSLTYDANGNILTISTADLTTAYTYDSLNRVLTVTNPLSHVTSYTYDGNGNVATVTDSEGQVTSYDHNYQGQTTLIEDAISGLTTMEYGSGCASCNGGADKLTSLSDALNKTTTFAYDATGHLTQELDPLGHATQYAYNDGRGNQTQRTDANGQTITYTYDKLNRLTQAILPDNKTVDYTYDATTGDLTNVAGPNIGYTFSYDTMGRMTSVTDTRGYTLAYAYNALGQRTLLTLPGSQTIAYGYDTGNRLSTLGTEAGIFTFSYDTKGRRSALAYPNGITSTYSYDNADQLTGLVHAATSGDILNIAYPSLDNIGNRIQRSEDSVTTSYSYDDLYRVLTATNTNATEVFTYDAVGNRLTGPTSSDAYTYNDVHQLTQAGTASYTYDSNGNQLTRDGWSQQWDAQNRLIQLQSSNGIDTITFKYDPFNRRIEKKYVEIIGGETTTTTTRYVYDSEDIVLQVQTVADDDGTTTTTETHFIHGPGIDEPLAMVEDGDKYYYHADGLGSIVAITDDACNVVQKYSYDSFGTPTPTDPDFIQPYTFTGREWDDEAELYFYRARYYDPSVGRFISKDPIGFAGGDVNVYAYVRNDSINWIDPSGLYIGQYPPVPPGYNSATWSQGIWDNLRHWIKSPNGDVYTVHPEDKNHWRHWDIRDKDNKSKGTWPNQGGKPRDNQKKLKSNQCTEDPSGNAPEWRPGGGGQQFYVPGVMPFGGMPIFNGTSVPVFTPTPAFLY